MLGNSYTFILIAQYNDTVSYSQYNYGHLMQDGRELDQEPDSVHCTELLGLSMM